MTHEIQVSVSENKVVLEQAWSPVYILSVAALQLHLQTWVAVIEPVSTLCIAAWCTVNYHDSVSSATGILVWHIYFSISNIHVKTSEVFIFEGTVECGYY